MTLGAWIRLQRKQKRWTQKTLAEALASTQTYVSRLEKDERAPGAGIIYGLARVFGVDPAEVWALAYPDRAGEPLPPPPDVAAATLAALGHLAPALVPGDWAMLLALAEWLARKNQAQSE